ncbi:hypothetical protein GCM10028832_02830 [Streptomyces sparsus]
MRFIRTFTRRMYEETGSVGRDRVENALRDADYTVSSDDAGRVVREFKNQRRQRPAPPRPDHRSPAAPATTP